ncbi:hypothetical protein SHAM105786_03060 [Shewanella amazonensis]|uniref:hypothetical protein n=1 Tax=Shewanella TaxID=22 RepID=UPI0002FFF508|nr:MULTISPECIES: hypothetical protein [Shewanella]QYJ76618.1 hypothetical protein K0H79_06535 [Shewanella sp. FJAT-52076]QYK06537.1 hypothetical protein K0H63_06910 [Shewanella zhangzhouensis]
MDFWIALAIVIFGWMIPVLHIGLSDVVTARQKSWWILAVTVGSWFGWLGYLFKARQQ